VIALLYWYPSGINPPFDTHYDPVVSITKLSSVSRVSPVSCCSNAPFLTPPQNLFCTTFLSEFLPRTPLLVQLSRDLNCPIPGCVMPHGPVQGSVTSTHATPTHHPTSVQATSSNRRIGLAPFPLPHPALSSSCRRSNGRRTDEDHAPSFIRSNLNGVPHTVRMPNVSRSCATSCSLQLRHCAAIYSFPCRMWKICLQDASAGSSVVARTHPKGLQKVQFYGAGGFSLMNMTRR